MLLAYFDEVKYQAPQQPYFWLGGLIVDAETVKDIDARLGELAKEAFGSGTLSRETEFHAAELFHRRGHFRTWTDVGKRLDLLKKLVVVMDDHDRIGKVVVRLDPSKMYSDVGLEHKAFMFFVERVQMYLARRQKLGMLIGDRENADVSRVFAEALSRYREQGTEYQFGTTLKWLIDTVHFTDSHLSRMLQLADLYVWLEQLASRDNLSAPAADLVGFVRKETRILSPHHYKLWPTSESWALQ